MRESNPCPTIPRSWSCMMRSVDSMRSRSNLILKTSNNLQFGMDWVQLSSTKHSRPHHHRWQVYLPTNSDASGLNTPIDGSHDATSTAYKTCVSTWLGPTLGLATTVQRHLIASAWGTTIDRKIMSPWLEGHNG
jgi:hypothetical protein